MDEITTIILYTLFAGACIPLGGAFAYAERIKPQWLENEFRHSVIAFGGGILLAAVALVLIPEGTAYVNNTTLGAIVFLSGGCLLFYVGAVFRGTPPGKAAICRHAPGLFTAITYATSLGATTGRGTWLLCWDAGQVYTNRRLANHVVMAENLFLLA